MTNNENKGSNPMMLQWVIIGLLIVIAILAFFAGKSNGTPTVNNNPGDTTSVAKDLSVTVIDDKRCTDCQTATIVDTLKEVPNLAGANFEIKDFSDAGVEQLIKDNEIKALPAFIFSHNEIGKAIGVADEQQLVNFLTELKDGTYALEVGANFNPFAKRSENGFLVAEQSVLDQIKSSSYTKGNADAQITWVEYSDLECPYCAKLHENGTPKDLGEKYGDKLNKIFNHFPLDFHKNAMPGAQVLECLGETNGSEAFYSLIEKSFSEKNSDTDFLIDEAVALGADKASLESCLDSDKYADKVTLQQTTGAENFGITGTPGNVLINNVTGEYQVISGAYPTAEFEKIIDSLLGE